MLLPSSQLFLNITDTSSYFTVHIFIILKVVLGGKQSILISSCFILPSFLSKKTGYIILYQDNFFFSDYFMFHSLLPISKTTIFLPFPSFSNTSGSRKITQRAEYYSHSISAM